MKAQKKPVVIDYVIYTGVKSVVGNFVKSFGDIFEEHFENIPFGTLSVKTLEGTSYPLISNKHVIIRGVKGEYYPCDIDIFLQTYDLIEN